MEDAAAHGEVETTITPDEYATLLTRAGEMLQRIDHLTGRMLVDVLDKDTDVVVTTATHSLGAGGARRPYGHRADASASTPFGRRRCPSRRRPRCPFTSAISRRPAASG